MTVTLAFTCGNCGMGVELRAADHSETPFGWQRIIDPSKRGYWRGPYFWCARCFEQYGHKVELHRYSAPPTTESDNAKQ